VDFWRSCPGDPPGAGGTAAPGWTAIYRSEGRCSYAAMLKRECGVIFPRENQCFGSRSAWIHIKMAILDPDQAVLKLPTQILKNIEYLL